MTIKTITVTNRPVKELYTGLEDPRSKKPGIRTSLPVRQPIEKDKNVKHNSKEFIKNERMIQTHELMRSNKPIGYSSKGKPVKVPNGATHYAAVIDSDNSVLQERSKLQKEEKSDPFDIARNLNDKIQDAAKAADLIEAKIDGFDIVKKGNNLIIKGAGSNTTDKLGIKGTKYSMDNLGKYPDLGKLVDPKLAAKDAFSIKGEGLIEPGIGIIQNIVNKKPGTKIVADAAVDVAKEKVTGAAAAIATAAVADYMLNSNKLTLNSSSKMPVYTTATVGGMIVETAVDNAVKDITDKAKESLKKGLDKLVNTDYLKADKNKPIERHPAPQKNERASKPSSNNNKPVTNTKPANTGSSTANKTNTKPKNDKPIERHPAPKKNERASKPTNSNNKPVKNDLSSKRESPRSGRLM